MPRSIAATAATALFVFVLPFEAIAQSKAARREAYCAKQPTPAEQEICLDRDLTRRDAAMTETYEQLREQLSKVDFARLRRQQRDWLKLRNKCSSNTRCLRQRYAARNSVLEGRVKKTPDGKLVWFLNKSDGDLLLRYGLPETDNVAFQASCTKKNNDVTVLMGYNTSGRFEGDKFKLRVSAGRHTSTRDATVFGTKQEEGISGARLITDFEDPLFSGLARGSVFTYGARGKSDARISLKGSAKPVDDFVRQCQDLQYEQAFTDGSPEDKARWATCKEFGKAKSLRARRPVTVTFVNNSDASRSVMWIDYKGQPQERATLDVGKTLTMKTFRTHPWMFTDGPGNCIEMYMPRRGDTRFEIKAKSPAFGPGQD